MPTVEITGNRVKVFNPTDVGISAVSTATTASTTGNEIDLSGASCVDVLVQFDEVGTVTTGPTFTVELQRVSKGTNIGAQHVLGTKASNESADTWWELNRIGTGSAKDVGTNMTVGAAASDLGVLGVCKLIVDVTVISNAAATVSVWVIAR